MLTVAGAVGCAGRSEHTPPAGAGGSATYGKGGAGAGGAGAGGTGAGGAGAGGTNPMGGTAGATQDYSVLPTCLQPAVSGVCNAYFERWTFNPITLQCEKFIYGGCGGNDNNFETAVDCEATCTSQYSDCDPISRGKGCPCDDARDCAYGSCSNAIYELTMDGYPNCPASPIGLCAGGAESCTCPLAGGDAFCIP